MHTRAYATHAHTYAYTHLQVEKELYDMRNSLADATAAPTTGPKATQGAAARCACVCIHVCVGLCLVCVLCLLCVASRLILRLSWLPSSSMSLLLHKNGRRRLLLTLLHASSLSTATHDSKTEAVASTDEETMEVQMRKVRTGHHNAHAPYQ
jgi:hypothetical protein